MKVAQGNRISNFIFILSLFVTGGSSSAYALTSPKKDCSQLLGSCEFYQCKAEEFACQDGGYFLKFGLKYCIGLQEKVRPHFSERGKDWMDDAGRCLRETLIPYSKDQVSCGEVENIAIASHVNCYVTTGFCGLALKEKLKILGFIKSELLNPKIIKAIIGIWAACGASSEISDLP